MSICKKFDCEKCEAYKDCGGCEKVDGCPFGTLCIVFQIIKEKGFTKYLEIEKKVIETINNLDIDKLHIDHLNVMPGSYVNLEYPLPIGNVKLLDDKMSYFTNQIEKENGRCYGIVSDGSFIIVAEYRGNGENPELVVYKKI